MAITKLSPPPINVDTNDWSWKDWFKNVYNIVSQFLVDTVSGAIGIGDPSPEDTSLLLSTGGKPILSLSGPGGPEIVLKNTGDPGKHGSWYNFTDGIYFDAYGAALATNNAIVLRVDKSNADHSVANVYEALRASSDGKVLIKNHLGIGAKISTSPNINESIFNIGPNGTVYAPTGSNGALTIAQNIYPTSGPLQYISSGPASTYNQSGGAHQWTVAASAPAGSVYLPTTVFQIDNSGNVGIQGTPSTASTGFVTLKFGPNSTLMGENVTGAPTQILLANNAEFTSNVWKYVNTGPASLVGCTNGNVNIDYKVSGTAGTSFTWDNVAVFSPTGLSVTGNVNATGSLGGSITSTQVFNAINLANNPDWYRVGTANTGFYLAPYGTGIVGTVAGRVDIYNGGSLFVPGAITSTSSMGINTAGSLGTISISDTSGNGTNFNWTHTGGNKTIRVLSNQMQWVNSAYSALTLVTDDLGNFWPAADNSVQCGIGTNRWSAIFCPTGVVSTSDGREKNTIINSTLGLNFINSLRPVSYKYNVGSNVIVEPPVVLDAKGVVVPPLPLSATIKPVPGSRTHWGLISQEVKSAVDAAGVDFGGFVLTDVNDPNSMQGLRYDQFIAPLIKAVQQLTARVQILEAAHIPPITPPAGP